MPRLLRSPGATMRFLKLVTAVLLIVAAIVIAYLLLVPEEREKGYALRAACWDAEALAASGMLPEARRANEGITDDAGEDPCSPRADLIPLGLWLERRSELAVREREKARAYFEASRLARVASSEGGERVRSGARGAPISGR